MDQRRDHLDLAQEPLGAAEDIGAQHLHREQTGVPGVAREVDGGHATVAQLALEQERPARQGLPQPIQPRRRYGRGATLVVHLRTCRSAGKDDMSPRSGRPGSWWEPTGYFDPAAEIPADGDGHVV
jgi:hypothetical protein